MYVPRLYWLAVELSVCRTLAWFGVATRPTTGADVCREGARFIPGVYH